MNIIAVDMETFYSPEFSLSKLTTEEYIRDPRFEVIGVSVKVNDGEAEWFSGTHDETRTFLEQYDWDNAVAVAHNAMFDAAILSWIFGIRPRRIADTLSMARAIHGTEVGGSLAKLVVHYALGEKGTEVINALGKRRVDFDKAQLERYGAYCINDTNLTHALFLRLVEEFPPKELRLIDLTMRMFTEPVLRLDKLLLETHLTAVRDHKQKLLDSVDATPEELRSNPKFAEILKGFGIDPPMKISKVTGKPALALAKTDAGFKGLPEQFPEGSPNRAIVEALCAARLGQKSTLEETRTTRFIDIADRGTLPIPLKYHGAHTSRWSGMGGINAQNLPSRGVDANTLKRAILAPKGYVMCEADSSQVEARVLAWMAGQSDFVQAFADGEDVYKTMAASIYNKAVGDITKPERAVGKATVLGAGYGMGPVRFREQIRIDAGIVLEEPVAEHIIRTYRERLQMIPRLWKQAQTCLDALYQEATAPYGVTSAVQLDPRVGGFILPSGLVQRYPSLHKRVDDKGRAGFVYQSRTGITRIHGPKVVENCTQGVARCIVGEQALKIAKRYKVVLLVHDSVVALIPENEQEEGQKFMEQCMTWRPDWCSTLPVACESGWGKSYGDC